MKWKMQLTLFKKQTPICKNCFKTINDNSFHELFISNLKICSACVKESNPIFKEFKIDGVPAISIYDYNEFIKGKFFLYKANGDYEMKDYFLYPYHLEFSFFYSGYVIVPIPSFKEKDIARGYNHVIEIFKCLGLKIYECLIKTKNIDQKDLNFSNRQKIGEYLIFDDSYNLKNKRILLVDDIVTTGASMKAAIKLLKKQQPKIIKILCIAKHELNEEQEKKLGTQIKL